VSAVVRRVSFGMKPLAGRSKFGNKLTLRHGIKFHSKKEADRYDQLLLLEKNGEVGTSAARSATTSASTAC
jgi:hypothetical protein